MIEILLVGGIISLFINLFMGLFVFFKNKRNPVNLFFGLFSLSIALWSGGSFLANLNGADPWMTLRICYVPAIFLPVFYLQFIYHVTKAFSFWVIRAAYGTAFVLFVSLLAVQKMFIAGIQFYQGYALSLPGPAYYVFFVFLNLCTSYGLYTVFICLKRAKGAVRKRLQWMLLAQLIAQVAGLEYFSSIFGLWRHIPIDDYILIGHFSVMTYAIIRHQLLDIEFVIKRTLVFAGLFSMTMLVVTLVTTLSQKWLGSLIGYDPVISTTLSIMIAFAFYEPARLFLISLTDRYLFQKKFDYKRLLKEGAREMAVVKSLKRLARVVVAFVVSQGKIRNASALVYDMEEKKYRVQALHPFKYDKVGYVLEEAHALIEELKRHQGPLELEDLQGQMDRQKDPAFKGRLQLCLEVLRDLQAVVAIPSFLYPDNRGKLHIEAPQLRSVLFLGTKKSDDLYNREDLDVFFTLAQESAIAIENARLYDEQIEAQKSLKDMQRQLVENERKSLLGKMTGGVAHEVRNPLSYTQNSVFFIKRLTSDLVPLSHDEGIPSLQRSRIAKVVENLPRYLELIQNATGRIKSVVQTIEAFAKRKEVDLSHLQELKFSKSDFSFETINIDMLLMLVLEELRFKYQSRGQMLAPVELQIEKGLPALRGDPNALSQVMFNLISNAHDAMKKSRVRKITIKGDRSLSRPDAICMEFQDTGCGIPEALKSKVWEYLFTTKKEEGGSGIGLLWCKTIIEDIHDGRIWFESREGAGTSFFLELPVAKE